MKRILTKLRTSRVHRPVWAVFGITRDDDGSDDGGSASVLVSKSTEPDPPEDVTIYITRTGKKYHRDGCGSLRRSKIPSGGEAKLWSV